MLQDRLQRDAIEALKARESGKKRLSVIRLLRAAVTNAEKQKGSELSDEEVLSVLAREAKRLEQDIREYKGLNRADRAAELEAELEIVRSYLPAQLTEEEILEAVSRAIAQTGASGPGDLGKVMKALMPAMRGRADGRTVNELVRRALAEQSG